MKTEWMKKIQDSLCIMLNHLLFVAAAITISDLFRADSPRPLIWMATGVIPFGLYTLIKRDPKLVPPPIFIFLLGVMSLAEKIMTENDWASYYYVIMFVYLIGYFLFYFTKQFLSFLTLNQSTASNIPIQGIFRNGIGLTLFFSICSSGILLVSANVDWLKAIADKIWSGILVLLKYVFAGIDTAPPIEGKEELTQQDPQMGGANMESVIPEHTLEDLRGIMIFLLGTAIVIGFLLFLYYVYWVIKGMEGVQAEKKIKNNLAENEDVREYCGIEKKSQRKKGISFMGLRNNREKIRRMYQKKVLKHKKELIGEKEQHYLKYLTARECCDRLSEQQLKLVYEKARYSEEEISSEDVKLAK